MRCRSAAWLVGPAFLFSSLAALAAPARSAEAMPMAVQLRTSAPALDGTDPITGPRSHLSRDWIGLRPVEADTPILVLAGHADSQGIAGSGTSGAAVAAGAPPMVPGISDELYWNMVVAETVVALGQQRGLRISYYRPPFRTISDGDHPSTNWSVGRQHAASGGYALEIHFDAWGPDGVGSGLIPPLHRPFGRLDESLAEAFGGFPMAFRGGLGGPRRGIALLEVGKLEGRLERSLRNPATRPDTVMAIASRIVTALEVGLGRSPTPQPLSPQPGVVGSAPPGKRLQASSGGE
ncbi:dehydrogenase [Cyanobium gracile]|uniref:Dehydrogenase n=1 Tax=Cyanobium gracile UHCC 0281 TaxID=3110309 RepID=A0ABU5SSF9_9CYAN|nr:dehydrogenase [Cyanobium gracile]MEA5441405.1 dehydrogenase [Cyanobium gracile UHCC 0281]